MNVTVIASLIAAIAAIIAPTVSAIITVRYQYKIKTIDLFFNAKLNAYQNLMESSSEYLLHANEKTVAADIELEKTAVSALLLSSPSTQESISLYVQSLITEQPPSVQGNEQGNVILAMQRDLYEFKHYRNHNKRT